MTLSLDEVRKTRFHMARRSGYEVLEVDSFVDKIEATLKALEEERDTMKRQLGALNKAGENTTGAQATTGAPAATPAAGAKDDEIAKLKSELAAAKKEAEQARQQPVTPAPAQAGQQGSAELEQLRKENAELKRQLAAKSETAQPTAAQPASAQPLAAQSHGAPAAQPAAAGTQHLVVTTSEEASPAVVQLVQLATQQAEAVTKQADEQAKRTISEANAKAESVNREATTRAQQTESEAKVKADKLNSDAQTRAKSLDDETNTKRSQLFSQLESERDQLTKKVEDLRSFESQYRTNLSQQLEHQLTQVKSGSFEPQHKPELLTESRPAGNGTQSHGTQHEAASAQHTTAHEGHAATTQAAPSQQAGVGQQPTTSGQQPTSNTPRLDALLGDQKDK